MRDLNVRQSFDGVRASVARGRWHVDAFAALPVQTRVGTFDDAFDKGRALWGAYGVRQLSVARRAGLDLYYLGYRRRDMRFDAGVGDERRHSFGLRIWGAPERADYNVEVVAQTGTFARSRIRAWTVASDTGYRLAIRTRPRFGLHADVTSGDRDPADDTLGTFNPLFPRGALLRPDCASRPRQSHGPAAPG